MLKKRDVQIDSTDTYIGKETNFEGEIKTKAGLRIEGRVSGHVQCDGDLTIGESGQVLADIQARNVYNAGVIEGSVAARNVLEITATGRLKGDIQMASLTIAEGGRFDGACRMERNGETRPFPGEAGQDKEHDAKSRLRKIDKTDKDEQRQAAAN